MCDPGPQRCPCNWPYPHTVIWRMNPFKLVPPRFGRIEPWPRPVLHVPSLRRVTQSIRDVWGEVFWSRMSPWALTLLRLWCQGRRNALESWIHRHRCLKLTLQKSKVPAQTLKAASDQGLHFLLQNLFRFQKSQSLFNYFSYLCR